LLFVLCSIPERSEGTLQPQAFSGRDFYLALICEISGTFGLPLRPLASIAVHRFFSCKIEL
jgi:hypothetical protein